VFPAKQVPARRIPSEYPRKPEAVPAFADRTALKTAVDNCLAKVPSGFECCSRLDDPADCGVAGTTDMPGWNTAGGDEHGLHVFSCHCFQPEHRRVGRVRG